ncbi:MAG: rRNA pseudouridine synthase [Rectinema sp.]|nr:rRNA pseudouridine synthase [Rectinema sp.]
MSTASDAQPMRLHAFLASVGVASRRACEELIRQGRVSVDGIPAAIGQKVTGKEIITVDGRRITAQKEQLRYILLNKPRGYLASMKDPLGRPCAIDLIAPYIQERIYNVGRLDQYSSGLLLFTNDGEVASRLVHPSGGIDKEYLVQADAPFPQEFANAFVRGILVDGIRYKALQVSLVGPNKARIVLVEGKNREIRRVLEHYGLRALSLERIRIGPIMDPSLPPGKWRELSQLEVRNLREYLASRSNTEGKLFNKGVKP